MVALEAEPRGQSGFTILESRHQAATEALIPADVSTCDACFAEVLDPGNRRYHYPFTNCTDCGPRFSIIETVPYDRSHTTMSVFAMCDACRAEYENPEDRRFHAEPTACPVCGPHLWLEEPGREPLTGRRPGGRGQAAQSRQDRGGQGPGGLPSGRGRPPG